MKRDSNQGPLANRVQRFSAPNPAEGTSGPVSRTVQLKPALTRPAVPTAPPVYRRQTTPPSMQPQMANGTVKRPSAPPVFRPQPGSTLSQANGRADQTRMATGAVQPFATGVIQGRCNTCGANSHTTRNCPRTRTAPTPTARRTAPSTLGTSHTRTTPSGNFVGHGAQAGAGGHASGRRARMLRTMLANSQST
jgi:hypothetical protein